MVDGNTVNINNPISCYNASKKEEQEIKGIIADLRLVIDQISLNFTSARNLIQELARRLDESKQCEQERLLRFVDKGPLSLSSKYIPIPDHSTWIVTMWHFGADSSREYAGKEFEMTWEY